jgi:hypothetical protein
VPEFANAFEQWVSIVTGELQAAGYEVGSHFGFPLVKQPSDWDAGVRLIELPLSVPCVKHIYAEGMLFTPEPVRRV